MVRGDDGGRGGHFAGSPDTLKAGKHSWSFSEAIPAFCPGTFQGQWGWVQYGEASSLEDGLTDHAGDGYFTDGLRAVLWVSGVPVDWEEVSSLEWDGPPPPRRGSE